MLANGDVQIKVCLIVAKGSIRGSAMALRFNSGIKRLLRTAERDIVRTAAHTGIAHDSLVRTRVLGFHDGAPRALALTHSGSLGEKNTLYAFSES